MPLTVRSPNGDLLRVENQMSSKLEFSDVSNQSSDRPVKLGAMYKGDGSINMFHGP